MLSVPTIKDLVLLGGGHSHIEVLRSWGMKPLPGVRLTLISRDMHTPYSGMLPGYVSGFYTHDECHVDLCRLTTFAKARLIHAEANGIDIKARQVLLSSRPAIHYDVLSVDIGITPAAASVPGASQHTIAVKPIDKFVARFDRLLERVRASEKPISLAIVGGGAGGVELALALAYRLQQERGESWAADVKSDAVRPVTDGSQGRDIVKLFCAGPILHSHPTAAAAAMRSCCTQAGVELHEHAAVDCVEAGRLRTVDGTWHSFGEALWCTQAGAASWLKATGLPTDDAGFLSVSGTLQSAGGPPEVFAAGDVASMVAHSRPKAGVYAVRQGPPLAGNLRRYLTSQPLQPFKPQSQALALITTGNRHAVGTYGWLTFQGNWAWKWKDRIDRNFMDKYGKMLSFDMMSDSDGSMSSSRSHKSFWPWSWFTNSSPEQQQQRNLPGAFQAAGAEGLQLLLASKMRCGGCGAKVGSSTLSRVLQRVKQQLQQQQQQQGLDQVGQQQQPPWQLRQQEQRVSQAGTAAAAALVGVGSDDAAVLPAPPPGHLLVSTVDFFRSFWPDAYLLGAISANHALGDCYAMGAHPASALALAVVPFGSPAYQASELGDLLSGALEVLGNAGCELVGGHSSEGAELAAGFAVTGYVKPAELMTKSGLRVGDVLILTKPLGTGTILAAAMQGKAKGVWVSGCLQAMQVSSAAASHILQDNGCRAATDVTGFGLLGHTIEMAQASQVQVQLSLSVLPLLQGAVKCIEQGVLSSLHASNAKAAAEACNYDYLSTDARYVLLCDPQTAGGLLAGVPAQQAEACLQALKAAGYHDAKRVGSVVKGCDADCGHEQASSQQLVPLVDVVV